MAMALVVSTPVVSRFSLAPPTCSDETWTSQEPRRRGRRVGASNAGMSGGVSRNFGGRLSNGGMTSSSKRVESRAVLVSAIFDPHSLAFLADLFDPQLDPAKFGVSLDITRPIIDEKSSWALSEESIKDFYMGCAFVFCWGCCVFGSMNDKFYESDLYRDAGGNGTGHWIYDQEAREEAAARDEMWSEDLLKEIEGKTGEGALAEEKEREKELV